MCGARLLKKKSKSGYYYYGCEKNPTCPFMTWDKPTPQKCPKCGGVLYRHYTKEEKKILCHVPGCGYFEELPVRKSTKAKADGEAAAEGEVKKPRRASAKKAAETAEKKPAARKRTAKKETAEDAGAPAKKTARKKTAKAEKTDV